MEKPIWSFIAIEATSFILNVTVNNCQRFTGGGELHPTMPTVSPANEKIYRSV
jgi:hypothetical protein